MFENLNNFVDSIKNVFRVAKKIDSKKIGSIVSNIFNGISMVFMGLFSFVNMISAPDKKADKQNKAPKNDVLNHASLDKAEVKQPKQDLSKADVRNHIISSSHFKNISMLNKHHYHAKKKQAPVEKAAMSPSNDNSVVDVLDGVMAALGSLNGSKATAKPVFGSVVTDASKVINKVNKAAVKVEKNASEAYKAVSTAGLFAVNTARKLASRAQNTFRDVQEGLKFASKLFGGMNQ